MATAMEKASVGVDVYCEENQFETCVARAIKYISQFEKSRLLSNKLNRSLYRDFFWIAPPSIEVGLSRIVVNKTLYRASDTNAFSLQFHRLPSEAAD